jgi:predicted porin
LTLLASTWLATLLGMPPAVAQTNVDGPPIRLGLGGYFYLYGVGAWQNDRPGHPGASRHNFDVKREAEVHFLGQAKLDNGLMIGVDVQLEAESCSDQIDESYIWFQGGWGRLTLGSENSAAYVLASGPPAVDGTFDSLDPIMRIVNTGAATGDPRVGAAGNGSDLDAWVPLTSGDSEKVTFVSRRVLGFRAGLSFTPDNSEEGTGGTFKGGSFAGMPLDNTTTHWSNLVALGLNYEGNLGPAEINLGGYYELGFREGERTQTVGGFTSRYSDRNAYSAELNVAYAGLKFGGAYFADDNGIDCTVVAGGCSGSGTQRSWGTGLTYTMGPLTVGASYLHSVRNRDPIGRAERLERVLVGARYMLGPGVDLRGSVHYYDWKTALGATDTFNDNHGTFVVFGTFLAF